MASEKAYLLTSIREASYLNRMVDQKQIDKIFHALADTTRRAILDRIRDEEFSVTELAEPFDMSLAAVSKHLKVLEKAGLINRTKQGKIHWCGLNKEPLRTASSVIDLLK